MTPQLLFEYCFMAVFGVGLGLVGIASICALIGIGTATAEYAAERKKPDDE